MGLIPILLLLIDLLFIVTGIIYFEVNMAIIFFVIILIINLIYMAVIKKLSLSYQIFKRWFKGVLLADEEWKELMLTSRQLLVVNYSLLFLVMIVYFLVSTLGLIVDLPVNHYIVVNLMQTIILYNGIFLAPSYLLLARKLKARF